jgi:hypothetical protein
VRDGENALSEPDLAVVRQMTGDAGEELGRTAKDHAGRAGLHARRQEAHDRLLRRHRAMMAQVHSCQRSCPTRPERSEPQFVVALDMAGAVDTAKSALVTARRHSAAE